MTLSLRRRMAAEFTGTGLLVAAVVGSGIAASRLSPHDVGLELLENAVATGLALAALIVMFAPVSGAHFNPAMSVADWWLHRRGPGGITGRAVAGYTVAQTGGAIVGAILTNVMFDVPTVAWSVTSRTGGRLWLAKLVATFGLLLLIFALARSGRSAVVVGLAVAIAAVAFWYPRRTPSQPTAATDNGPTVPMGAAR